MEQSVQQQIVDLLLQKQKILIMASSPADGDCIGSSLGLYLVLKKLGKEVTVVCPDPIPDVYHFLPMTHVIGDRVVASKDFIITIDTKKVQSANVKSIVEDGKINIIIMPENGRLSEEDVGFNYGPERYDAIIAVDTGGVEQLGALYSGNIEMFHQIPLINIDHHFSNAHYGKINYVDPMASATTELVTPLITLLEEKAGKELWDEDIATLLLTGIITDTGSFQNANTTPRAFDASAKLIAHGARQQEIIQHIFKTKQLTTLKLWGRILTKMQTDEKFHIVWSILTRKDFEDTGAQENETGGIIDELLSNAPGAEIICLLKEKKDNLISGSVRTTNPSVDASALAEMFGGGGHSRAAGFKVAGSTIEKVETEVLAKFREYQTKRLGVIGPQEPVVSQPPVETEKPQSDKSDRPTQSAATQEDVAGKMELASSIASSLSLDLKKTAPPESKSESKSEPKQDQKSASESKSEPKSSPKKSSPLDMPLKKQTTQTAPASVPQQPQQQKASAPIQTQAKTATAPSSAEFQLKEPVDETATQSPASDTPTSDDKPETPYSFES